MSTLSKKDIKSYRLYYKNTENTYRKIFVVQLNNIQIIEEFSDNELIELYDILTILQYKNLENDISENPQTVKYFMNFYENNRYTLIGSIVYAYMEMMLTKVTMPNCSFNEFVEEYLYVIKFKPWKEHFTNTLMIHPSNGNNIIKSIKSLSKHCSELEYLNCANQKYRQLTIQSFFSEKIRNIFSYLNIIQ